MEKQKKTNEDQDRPEETKRAMRKRRPVLKEQNFSSDDSDFEEDTTSFRKAPSQAKNPKTKTKARTSKLQGRKGTERETGSEKDTELQQDRLKMRRRSVNNNLVSLLAGFSSGLVRRSLVTAAAVRSE